MFVGPLWVNLHSHFGELFDVMRQAVSLPLPIDLGLPAESEPVQPLVMAQIAKYWLHRRKASSVSHLALSSLFTPYDTDKLS